VETPPRGRAGGRDFGLGECGTAGPGEKRKGAAGRGAAGPATVTLFWVHASTSATLRRAVTTRAQAHRPARWLSHLSSYKNTENTHPDSTFHIAQAYHGSYTHHWLVTPALTFTDSDMVTPHGPRTKRYIPQPQEDQMARCTALLMSSPIDLYYQPALKDLGATVCSCLWASVFPSADLCLWCLDPVLASVT
jgi:hypothetical protein